MNRRIMMFGAPLALAGCATTAATPPPLAMSYAPRAAADDPDYEAIYAALDGEPFPVPAIDLSRIVDAKFLRREVDFETAEPPGTVVVDPNERFAWYVIGNGRAVRYGVGVGKVEAFNFQGEATIAWKARWPKWTPTPDMIAREPERYGPLRDGLPGGPRNPLGPRALYLHRDGRDTLYRLHGTVEPWTIGTKASSGCIRLLNQDIVDLHDRVRDGARAVVLPIREPAATA
jgi:lipoprotein-anchoring transpeptidase ErfK/SrfK